MSEINYVNNPVCPFCGAPPSNPKPKEARENPLDGGWYRIRNYICTGLGKHAYSTEETFKPSSTLYVKKSNGNLSEFKFGKIMNGIQCAAADEISIKKCKEISYKVMRALSSKKPSLNKSYELNGAKLKGKVFHTHEIGEEVLAALFREGYHKAWVRFSLIFYKSDLGDSPNYSKIIDVLSKKTYRASGE